MASINDVFNQLQAVNTKLDLLHADGIAEIAATNQVKASVDNLDNDVTAGFAATTNLLNILATIDVEVVKLLFHLTQQADTMICALEHISKNTCGILTQTTIQTQLQERIADDVSTLRAIAEYAEPQAALDHERHIELEKKIERCCPPERPRPACDYKPCPSPRPMPMPELPKRPDQPPPIG